MEYSTRYSIIILSEGSLKNIIPFMNFELNLELCIKINRNDESSNIREKKML
jgi:hypothetical protein